MSVDTSRLMVVALGVSLPPFSAMDKEISTTVTQTYGANEKSGRYTKQLVNPEYVKDLKSTVRKMREVHEKLTMPYLTKGLRLLTVDMQAEYVKEMQSYQHEIYRLADILGNSWEDAKRDAKTYLGGSFKEEEYPTGDEIVEQVSVDFTFMPIPDARGVQAWAEHLSAERVSQLEDEYRATLNEAYENAHQHVLRRLVDRARAFVANVDAKNDGGGFHASVLEGLKDIVSLVQKGLAVKQDPAFDNLVSSIDLALKGATVEGIKTVESDRLARRDSIDKALQKFQGVFD